MGAKPQGLLIFGSNVSLLSLLYSAW